MDFARKILNKYGWKEGEGLGKHNDGIVKPLKASMKFDNAGLGSDQAASDFNNHWWERVFNEAAGNVEVRSGENGVRMDLKNKDDTVEISTKGYSLNKLKKAKSTRSSSDTRYDNFLQSSTLTKSGDEIENPNKIAVADISVTQYKALTDEELFKACGGRTAHKGARHGLKLSGKLSRIEQQEKELLEKMQQRVKTSPEELSKQVAKKNKRKKNDRNENFVNGIEQETVKGLVEEELNVPQSNSEKTLKKRNNKNKDLYLKEAKDDTIDIENRKKKKSKRKQEEYTHDPTAENISNVPDYTDIPKKKPKDDNNACDTVIEKTSKQSKKPNKKKHKKV